MDLERTSTGISLVRIQDLLCIESQKRGQKKTLRTTIHKVIHKQHWPDFHNQIKGCDRNGPEQKFQVLKVLFAKNSWCIWSKHIFRLDYIGLYQIISN